MSYPQGYLYQPGPGSLALYPLRSDELELAARCSSSSSSSSSSSASSTGSAFTPYPASAAAAFSASAAGGFASALPYTDPTTGFPSYMASPYDPPPSAMAAPLGFPPYGSAGFPPSPYQLNDPAYRKNATRDATSTLKAWLQEHRKNPYPTKGEKIMLAIITKMTLTQVSTWFANARRRLKKENKMTWGARSKSDDEDDEEGMRTNRKEEDDEEKHVDNGDASAEDEGISLHVDSLTDHSVESDGEKVPCRIDDFSCKPSPESKEKHPDIDLTSAHSNHGALSPKPMASSPLTGVEAPEPERNKNKACLDPQSQNTKPKLWSLAEIATSDPKQPLQSQNCPSAGGIWTCNQSGASPSAAILARPIYYTSPFYGNYGNYGNFGQGILRYGSIHKPSAEMLKASQANHASHIQMEHFRVAETKKADASEVCAHGPQSYLSS